jgi:hypothetical protein
MYHPGHSQHILYPTCTNPRKPMLVCQIDASSLASLCQDLTLCTAANPLATNLGTFAPGLSLLQLSVIHETAAALSTTADPLAGNLLARTLTLLKIHGSLVVALLAGANPVVTDLLASALSLLKAAIVSLDNDDLVTLGRALRTTAKPFTPTFLHEHCRFSRPLSSRWKRADSSRLVGHLGPPQSHSSPTLWHEHCRFSRVLSSRSRRAASSRLVGHLGPIQIHSSPTFLHEHCRFSSSPEGEGLAMAKAERKAMAMGANLILAVVDGDRSGYLSGTVVFESESECQESP